MDCKEFEALIDAYLEDELTRDKKEAFTEHLSSCESCRHALAFAENVRNTLSSLPQIEVPADFTEMLHSKLATEKKHSPFSLFVKRYGAIAACLILAAVIGTGIMHTDFSNKFNFTGEDISGATSHGNDEISDKSSLITPRSGENIPAPARSRTAEPDLDTAEDVTALAEAYSLDAAETSPIVITVSGVGGDFAKELALMAGTLEDGIYTMGIKEFENFVDALETVGVEFTQSGDAKEDSVRFEIAVK